MNVPSVLLIVSVSLALTMIDAEITTGSKIKLKMLDVLKSTNRKNPIISFDRLNPIMSNMEIEDNRSLQKTHVNRHNIISRKKRQTLNMVPGNFITDLKDTNTMDLINIGDIVDNKRIIKKRHACRNHSSQRNHRRYENNYYKEATKEDSSEESKEVNTEDTLGDSVASTERNSKKDDSNEVTNKPYSKSRNSDDKRSKHDSKDRNKSNDSGESADDKEFIFTNVPHTVFKDNKENKNRRDNKPKHDSRFVRGVIEEESVATTTSVFKFTSGDSDYGSNVAFRNVNV